MGLFPYMRLLRAGFVLAREGALSLINTSELPRTARLAIRTARLVERGAVKKTGRVERLTKALNKLGPTYVKFGQLLATRPDIVGAEIAQDLSALQDRMDPFDEKLVPQILQDALGDKAKLLTNVSAPVAAASIAQVHKAEIKNGDGMPRIVAVKLLRPGVKERFAHDLKSFYAGARLAEWLLPASRRLQPVLAIGTLERSALLELDLRFEAAAISEFSENIAEDEDFTVPEVQWELVAGNVLTTSWVEGIGIRDLAALDDAGIDREKLATDLMQGFLRHAIRDGFFHADMHPGNLFVDAKTHGIIAVDFGIMGRIGAKERRFLADILFGFITRDYRTIARRHFEIGYVPNTQSIDDFAMALRAVGEPLHGKLSREFSMAKMLGQLFTITELFDMKARPELLLLQKNMVLVEGVARALYEDLNMWDAAEPVVRDWLQQRAGPLGRLEETGEHLRTIGDMVGQIPSLVTRANNLLAEYEAQKSAPVVWRYRGLLAGIAIGLGVAIVAWWIF